MSVVFLTLPAFFALTIKGWLLFKRKGIYRNHTLMGFFAALSLLNVAEVMLLLQSAGPDNLMPWLRIYYVGAVASVTGLFLFSLQICLKRYLQLITIPSMCVAASVSALFVVSDVLIIDYKLMEYTITRVPGEHYWVFQVYSLLLFASSILILLWGYLYGGEEHMRRHSAAALIAITPPVLVGALILAFMSMDYSINAVVYLPVAISIMLVVLVVADNSDERRSLLSYVPGTKEFILSREIRRLVLNQNMGHKEQIKAFKNILSKNLVEEHGSLNQAAKNSDIPLATLRRWLKGE